MLPVLWHIFSFYWNFNKDPCPSLPVSFRVRIQLFAEPSSCILIAWLNCIAAANWARFGFGFVWKVKAKAECASMEPQPGRNEITARPQGKQSRTACGFLFILPKQSSAAKLEKNIYIEQKSTAQDSQKRTRNKAGKTISKQKKLTPETWEPASVLVIWLGLTAVAPGENELL